MRTAQIRCYRCGKYISMDQISGWDEAPSWEEKAPVCGRCGTGKRPDWINFKTVEFGKASHQMVKNWEKQNKKQG